MWHAAPLSSLVERAGYVRFWHTSKLLMQITEASLSRLPSNSIHHSRVAKTNGVKCKRKSNRSRNKTYKCERNATSVSHSTSSIMGVCIFVMSSEYFNTTQHNDILNRAQQNVWVLCNSRPCDIRFIQCIWKISENTYRKNPGNFMSISTLLKFGSYLWRLRKEKCHTNA
jgi:hypothetical protein